MWWKCDSMFPYSGGISGAEKEGGGRAASFSPPLVFKSNFFRSSLALRNTLSPAAVSSPAKSLSRSPSGRSGMPNWFTFGTCDGSADNAVGFVEAMRRQHLVTLGNILRCSRIVVHSFNHVSLSPLVGLIFALGLHIFNLGLFVLLLSEDPADDLQDLVHLFGGERILEIEFS